MEAIVGLLISILLVALGIRTFRSGKLRLLVHDDNERTIDLKETGAMTVKEQERKGGRFFVKTQCLQRSSTPDLWLSIEHAVPLSTACEMTGKRLYRPVLLVSKQKQLYIGYPDQAVPVRGDPAVPETLHLLIIDEYIHGCYNQQALGATLAVVGVLMLIGTVLRHFVAY